MIKKKIIWQLTDRGFCSEMNLMLLAYLYSLKNGIEFSLYSKSWNSLFELGWQDYFLPFCQEINSKEFQKKYLIFPGKSTTKIKKLNRKMFLGITLGKQILSNDDIWNKIWNKEFTESYFDVPNQKLKGDCFSCCQELIRRIWRFNPIIHQDIESAKKLIGLTSISYFAIHIRRGDKIKENSYTQIHEYIQLAKKINKQFLEPIENCFVMTDDCNVIDELQYEWPDLKIFTLCEASNSGHDQSKFNSSSLKSRRDETIKFISELNIAQESKFFVGTYSSNISRFLALIKGKSDIHSVDAEFKIFHRY